MLGRFGCEAGWDSAWVGVGICFGCTLVSVGVSGFERGRSEGGVVLSRAEMLYCFFGVAEDAGLLVVAGLFLGNVRLSRRTSGAKFL